MKYTLIIAWLYPDLMSTYGDRGNILTLVKRSQWRDIEVKVNEVTIETPLAKLKESNLIFMGGAQDRQQKIAGVDFLHNKGPIVKDMVECDIPALFVCAAYQFVGHYYRPYQGKDITGAGIFDLVTIHPGDQASRLIGNTVGELVNPVELAGKTVVGFENHGGRTTLGPHMKPLAKVIKGFGNNGEDGYEGALYKHAIGNYFHGPFLPKNPHVADWLVTKALAKKYGEEIHMKPLPDELEWRAHECVKKFT